MEDNLLGRLPPMKGKTVELVQSQNVSDIIRGVLDKHRETVNDYDLICPSFISPTVIGICKGLFYYCKEMMPYREESIDLQTVRTPAATLALSKTWGADCKHYAGFIGGVLDALNRVFGTGIDWCYRFASYEFGSKSPGHVFIVVDPDSDKEIWVDPVLKDFDSRTPCPTYIFDKKSNMSLVSISGVKQFVNPFAGDSGHAVGAANDVGSGLIAISPALSEIPVVGWIAGGVSKLVGTLLLLFGNRYENSSEVRHLIEKYEYKVLGVDIHSRQDVNEALKEDAQGWFTLVLGVPIYDWLRVQALMGNFTFTQMPKPVQSKPGDPFYNLDIKHWRAALDVYNADVARVKTVDESVAEYMRQVDLGTDEAVEEGIVITPAAVRQAAVRARALLTNDGTDKGGWAGYTVAPALVSTDVGKASVMTDVEGQSLLNGQAAVLNDGNNSVVTSNTNTTMSDSNTDSPVVAAVGSNALSATLLLGAIGWGVYEATKKPTRKVGKPDNNNTLLIVGGLGLAAVVLLMKSNSSSQSQSVPLTALQQQQQLAASNSGGSSGGSSIWSALPSIASTVKDLFGNIFGGKSSSSSSSSPYSTSGYGEDFDDYS